MAVVGQESGRVTLLTFLRYRKLGNAERMLEQLRRRPSVGDLTRYELFDERQRRLLVYPQA